MAGPGDTYTLVVGIAGSHGNDEEIVRSFAGRKEFSRFIRDPAHAVKQITLPASVTSLRGLDFANHAALEAVDMSKTEIRAILPYAFSGCTSLKTVGFPEKLATIAHQSFMACTSLAHVDLSGTRVTAIGDEAFAKCTSLETVVFPDTLREIGTGAFQWCTSLAAVDLSVTDARRAYAATWAELVIRARAFRGCAALATVTFPYSMDQSRGDFIGRNAFTGCPGLEKVNVGALKLMNLPNGGRGVFPRADRGSLVENIEKQSFMTAALALGRRDTKGTADWRDIHGVIDTHVNNSTRDDYTGAYPITPRDPGRARFTSRFASSV